MKKFASYIAGVITGIMIISVPIFADSYTKAIDALVNATNIKVNGAAVESDNFVVDGKTYVWIRDVATMLGKKIDWNESTSTANIVDEGTYIATEDDGQIIATVNETGITKGSVNSTSLLNPNGTTNDEKVQNALDAEIDMTVQLNEAAKNGFVLTDEITASASSYLEQYRSYYKEKFASTLSPYNLTEDTYRDYIAKSMIIDKFRSSLLTTKTFTEEESRAKYKEISDRFQKTTVKHILIKSEGKTDEEAKALIEKIAKEVKTVADFDKAMAKYSEDTETKDKTEGFSFGKGEMVPEFETAAFTQDIGKIGAPVKSSFGYHIILVTERGTDTFENVKAQCDQALFEAWYKTQIKEWKNDSKIDINHEVFDSLKNK